MSITRTLQALDVQDVVPDEIIIVDASDPPLDSAVLPKSMRCPVVWLRTAPGVCAQRNAGIRHASGSHVLLCDDDIEPPVDYIRKLSTYIEAHPTVGAVTGLVCEPDRNGVFRGAHFKPSFRHLLFAFLFQHTVWADVESAAASWPFAVPLELLKRWYRRRANTWSYAGWPLFTQLRGAAVQAATYGLGAALVRRDWLVASPFDERLGAHGTGDNYGVALGFPDPGGIIILMDLPVLHHRVPDNRLDSAEAYLQRVLALDYFTRTSKRFPGSTTAWLTWSLLGKAIIFAIQNQRALLQRNWRALALIASSQNPLLAHDPSQVQAGVDASRPGGVER